MTCAELNTRDPFTSFVFVLENKTQTEQTQQAQAQKTNKPQRTNHKMADFSVPVPKTNEDQILSVSFNQEARFLSLLSLLSFFCFISFCFSSFLFFLSFLSFLSFLPFLPFSLLSLLSLLSPFLSQVVWPWVSKLGLMSTTLVLFQSATQTVCFPFSPFLPPSFLSLFLLPPNSLRRNCNRTNVILLQFGRLGWKWR